MNNCKHCMEIKENEIGETVAFCELSDQWENVTLGSCFGNCEGQEFTADYISQRLNQLSDCAYDWHIDNKVVGIDVCEFEQLMDVAAKMILEAEPKRKTGRWIKPTGMMPPEYHGHYECSECGAWAMCTYHKSKVRLTRYCPGCGIKMENADV